MKLLHGVRWLVLTVAAYAVMLAPALAIPPQVEDKVCQLCHADVKADETVRGSHVDLACVDCHSALAEWDPAEESDHAEKVAKVNCTLCHADAKTALGRSAHRAPSPADSRPYPSCTACHGTQHFLPLFETLESAARKRAVSESCAACHEKDLASFADSAHDKALDDAGGAGPSCADCHGAHDVLSPLDPKSAMHAAKASESCEACHKESRASLHHAPGAPDSQISCLACHSGHKTDAATLRERVFADGGVNKCSTCHSGQHEGSLPAGVDCSACHTFHWDVQSDGASAPARTQSSCVSCHAEAEAHLAGSAHEAMGSSCTQCHATTVSGVASKCAENAAREVDCAKCHTAAETSWKMSPHAARNDNQHVAARCTDCHGGHEARGADDPASKTYPLNLPNTCERCHSVDPLPEHPAPAGAKVAQYESSVHGRALRVDGLVVSATCASCHGGHDIRRPDDPDAPTSRRHLPFTCGECHAGILSNYLEGVHGKAFTSGSAEVPVCNDCHSEHAIQDPMSAESNVSSKLVAETCARCHGDDEFARRHGLKTGVRASFGTSYHGIASSLGAEGAANCASCHGFHDIFPSTDPRSSIHADNLDATCGSCHSQAGAAFARVPVHSVIDAESNPVPYWVRTIYTWLVVAVIGAFILFILFDLFGRLRLRLKWGPPETEHVAEHEWPDEDKLVAPHEKFRRMGRHGRFQHAILVSSFMLLVVTGVPVFLHDVGFMRSIIDLEGGFALRSTLHRVGAVGLIGLSLWHILVVLISTPARRWVMSMMFRPRDITDFAQEMLFNLGIMSWLARRKALAPLFARFPWLKCDKRPLMGRYGLVEKLEYGAVVWGNFVMIATGFILWRPGWFLDWMPAWTFEVCRVIHGFEATLAFLAIIIWHMYHVHLRPGVFPMSRVWLDGNISRADLKHHHPGEYIALLERRRKEANQSPQP
jgi:cytochrome b subunit of formate dehydrogenase